jgi:hypothetical protein
MNRIEKSNDKPIPLTREEYRGLSPIGKKIADFLIDHGQAVILGESGIAGH